MPFFDSRPGSNIWDLVCHQSRTACELCQLEGPGHFKKPQLEVAEECWRRRNARSGRSHERSDCFPFVFERMGSHVSGKLLAVYLVKQSAFLTWVRNIVTEQLDEGHFTLVRSSIFCILFHCDCPTKRQQWQRRKGSRCAGETGQRINSLTDRRLLRG